MDTATARPSVFISYSHQDEAWKNRLVKQLQVLQLEGDLEVWDDRQIDAGDDWRPEIEAAMAGARAAVLLISADFLTSGFIRGTEVPEILRCRASEGLLVIPVIVRSCPWQAVSWLSPIQSRPTDGKELASFTRAKADRQLTALALEIRDLLAGPPPLAPPPRSGRGESGSDPSTNSGRVGAPSPVPRGRDGEGDPPLHNLPYSRLGDLFTGRQEELEALSGNGTAAITQSTALSGLGGIGKTRLAVEYAWRAGNRHTAAWFVRADSPESLRRNLAALAGPELMNLPEREAGVEENIVAAVKRWLREHPGWLMILDNVDTPEAARAVLEVLPSLSHGRVLITSRLTTWPATVQARSLDTLSSEEATHFLLQRTDGGREKAEDDGAQACELTRLLNGLPLALEQAAAYIIRHRMRFAEYLRAWEQEKDNLLQWYDPLVMQYPASVAVTWKQTFDRLSSTPAALLRLTAFLAPDPFPFKLLDQGADHLKRAAELFCEETGKAADGKSIREATADLADYSLITRQGGGMLVVHRMVQEVLRSQIPEEQRRDWIEGTLRVVNAAAVGDSGDVRTWPIWSWLRPHAAGIAEIADQVGIVDPTSRLMSDLAVQLWAKGLYSEAEPLARRALEIDEASLGNENRTVAIRLNVMALILQGLNRLGEAEPLLRRALHIDEASLGKEHPEVATDLNNLAQLLQATNRLVEAEPLMRLALDILETSQHPNHAGALNNLALLLQDTNRLEEAEPLMRSALHIEEDFFGKEHPNVAIDLNSLARLLQKTNRLGEAEPLMRRAVDIWERSLGSDHPRTQLGRRNLAGLLAEMAAAGLREGDESDDSGDGVSGDATGPAPG